MIVNNYFTNYFRSLNLGGNFLQESFSSKKTAVQLFITLYVQLSRHYLLKRLFILNLHILALFVTWIDHVDQRIQ